MTPTYSDIQAFSRQAKNVSNAAKNEFMRLASAVNFDNWTEAAAMLRRIIAQVCRTYGAGASELGAQWYEFCRAGQFARAYTALVYEVEEPLIVATANVEIDKLFAGEVATDALVARLSSLAGEVTASHVKRTIAGNLSEDVAQANRAGDKSFSRKAYYARVPQGDETCAYCVTLASRGYVYHSEDTARAAGHLGCDCAVVPFAKSKEINGYGAAWRRYADLYDEADHLLNDMPDELKARIDVAKSEHEKRRIDALAVGDKSVPKWSKINDVTIAMRYANPGMH